MVEPRCQATRNQAAAFFFYSRLFFAQQDNLQCAEVPYVHASSPAV